MRIRTTLFIVAVAAVVLVASGLLVGIFPTTVEAPPEVTTPPAVPEGTVYWIEIEVGFRHLFVDNEGRGHWQIGWTPTGLTYGTPETYEQHDIQVWEEDLDDGFSWNLNGKCEFKGWFEVYFMRDDGQLRSAQLARWPDSGDTLISFPCNQGAFGDLIVRPPTFFVKQALPGDGFVRYHIDLHADLAFRADGYQELDSESGSIATLCPAANAGFC